MNYAQMRDIYHRSFGDRTLRLKFIRYLNRNRDLKKLHNLFSGVFLLDDFICTDCGTTDVSARFDCPECGLMMCGDCSYAVCWRCSIRTDAVKHDLFPTPPPIMSDAAWDMVFKQVMRREYGIPQRNIR